MTPLYQIDKVTSRTFFTFSDIYLLGERPQHPGMATIDEIRRINARKLAERAGSDTAFAERVEMSPSRISQLIGKTPVKNIGRATARRMEAAFHQPTGWLDVLHDEQDGTVAESHPAQVVETAPIAANDEVTAEQMLEFFEVFRKADLDTRTQVMSTLRAAARLAARKTANRRPRKPGNGK